MAKLVILPIETMLFFEQTVTSLSSLNKLILHVYFSDRQLVFEKKVLL